MKKINIMPEIINQYLLTRFEIINIKLTYLNYKRKVQYTFTDSDIILITLRKEINEYLHNLEVELKLIKFMLKNEKRLYVSDIRNMLKKLETNYKQRYFYAEELFENLQTALEMECDYKFYVPRNKPEYLKEFDYEKYITYIKGFNLDRVKEFLIDEEIFDEQRLEEVLKKTKILDIDAKGNIEFFGVFDKGVVIPTVKDGISSLINVHELVHEALLSKKEELDDEIALGEDLPKFYELLFKARNTYISEECNEKEIALELFDDYNEESFEEQINKLSRIKNRER